MYPSAGYIGYFTARMEKNVEKKSDFQKKKKINVNFLKKIKKHLAKSAKK